MLPRLTVCACLHNTTVKSPAPRLLTTSDNLLAGGFSVFAGVGERTREGNDLYKEMTESVSTYASAMLRNTNLGHCIKPSLDTNPSSLEFLLQGVIKLGEKASESKCTLVYGQMNEPPGARARVALTGTWHLCTQLALI